MLNSLTNYPTTLLGYPILLSICYSSVTCQLPNTKDKKTIQSSRIDWMNVSSCTGKFYPNSLLPMSDLAKHVTGDGLFEEDSTRC